MKLLGDERQGVIKADGIRVYRFFAFTAEGGKDTFSCRLSPLSARQHAVIIDCCAWVRESVFQPLYLYIFMSNFLAP